MIRFLNQEPICPIGYVQTKNARKGKNKLVEVVSRSQTVAELTDKTAKMVSQNTNTIGKVISMKWARLTPKKWRLY